MKVTKIELSISYTELSKYFKRMGIFAMQGDLDKIIREFEEEEEL